MVVRCLLVLAGMALVAFGIALARQTLLGSSAISAIPTVLSFAFPLTIGTFTFILSILFIILQIILLRRDFSPVQFLQLPLLVVFSLTIDGFVVVASMFPFDTYLMRIGWMLLSCVAIALGVYVQTQVRLIMLPGDAIVVAISKTSGKKFSNCKLGFDISQMVIAAGISLACSGALIGVREGTLIAAVLGGPIIQFFTKSFGDFHRFVPVEGHPSFLPEATTGLPASDAASEQMAA